MPPGKQSEAGSSSLHAGKQKRTSGSAVNDGSSYKRHKETHYRDVSPPEQYIYIVIQTTSGPWQESTWNIRGTYASLKDANNEVISLWKQEPDMRGSGSEKGIDQWGCIWWNFKDLEGECMEAKVERLMVKPESGNPSQGWGKHAPGMEEDEGDESTVNYWKRLSFWDENANQSSGENVSTTAPKREGESLQVKDKTWEKSEPSDIMSPGNESAAPTMSSIHPDRSLYEAAIRSVRNNKHISNMPFHAEFYRDMMRQMQATYNVKQLHWPNQGYGFRIRLIWDHDRLWGTFELGFFKGVFLIDPGPGQDHFQARDEYEYQNPPSEAELEDEDPKSGETGPEDEEPIFDGESREYPLVWRGTSTEMPDTLFFSTLTVGKIRIGRGEIWGHFETMPGVGLPDERCEFHGKKPFGPSVVTLSVQDAVIRVVFPYY